MFQKFNPAHSKTLLALASATALLATTAFAQAQTTIVEETFDGNLGIFTGTGRVSTSGFDALLRGGANSAITSNLINLSGYTNISVSYERNTSGIDFFESFSVEYSINGGSFVTIEEDNSASGVNSVSLPSTADGQNLTLRFSIDASSYFETLEVDDVIVSGTADGGGNGGGGGTGGGEGGALPPVNSVAVNGPFNTQEDRNTGPTGSAWVVRPSNLGQDGIDHPIFVWGPGAGTGPAEYDFFLERVASHGFVVYSIVSTGDGDEMIDGLDWLLAQNSNPSSPYFGHLDADNIAFGGHSRGSLSTFGAADDPRLTTTIHVAGGSFDGQGAFNLRNPALYVAGEDDFLATPNVEEDYDVTSVPVFFTTIDDTDHIMATRNGQEVIVDWLRWHLAGEDFRSANFIDFFTCAYCSTPYTTEFKNW